MDETLYRFYDEGDQLLYVGISNNWQQRLKQHYKASPFHQETAKITLTHYETRAEVENAEKQAILQENPKYNKALNPNWENPAEHIQKIKFWVYSNIAPDDEHSLIVQELKTLFFEEERWTRKNTGPIAYFLLMYLPDWAARSGYDCQMCVDAYHSKQIESWAEQWKGAADATY